MMHPPSSDMQRVKLLAEIVADTFQHAPWVYYMQMLVPFSPSVCVAGSVGTWLAEYDVHGKKPSWDPNDINVFVMVPSRQEYDALCNAFVDSFASPPVDQAPIRISVAKTQDHILIVKWWLTCNEIEVRCPDFSFIHSPAIHSVECLLGQFDIDVCMVSVRLIGGCLCCGLSAVVRSHIHQRVMHVVMKQDPTCAAFHYPFQKSLNRVTQYSERGFKFESMQFWPSHSVLNVAVFEHVWTPPHVSVTFSK
jgi:hypothetical protein